MRIKMSASEVHRCASPPDEIKTVFDNFFSSQRPLFSLSDRIWNPPTDVYETCESMVIKMEVAGVKQEDMDISVDNNLLLIRGRRLEETPLRKENFYLMLQDLVRNKLIGKDSCETLGKLLAESFDDAEQTCSRS